VVCVGGTWLAPAPLMTAREWPKIQDLAAHAAALAAGRS
jgi:2-keto-3-deoxy-6-phosphogluconate aldolase